MKFVITNKSNIIYGPAEYSVGMFKYILLEDCGLSPQSFTIPSKLEGKLDITADIKFLPVGSEIYPNMNSKIQQLAGPFYTISNDSVKVEYKAVDKPLDVVKNELKAIVAKNRYEKEISEISLEIKGIEVKIDGSRENKTIIMLAYGAMPEGLTSNWKFQDGVFVECSKEDIGSIVTACVTQTQLAFDWEAGKVKEIDSANSLNALDIIDLGNPKTSLV